MRHGTTLALVPFCLGIALLGTASAGPWSLPDDAQGIRISPLLLLSRPDVREDLRLDPNQAAGVDREIVEVFRQAAALRNRTDPGVLAERRAVDERAQRWLVDHLSGEQRERLAQLELRWEGAAALTYRPAVAEALSLSEDQKTSLARAVAERNARRVRAADPSAEQQRLTQTAMALLSDRQKGHWERLLGPPFLLRPVAAPDPAVMPASARGR